MRYLIFALLITAAMVTGCSMSSDPASPSTPVSTAQVGLSSMNWTWGQWLFHVNESHTVIEAIPVRETSWHLNVTNFVEGGPCPDCLQIGYPHPAGNGTIKVKVTLRHPFPGHPEFTGFDVRGLCIFPATRHWYADDINICFPNVFPWPEDGPLPMFFSLAGDGGGGLLNEEGFSYYFWPGFDLGVGYEAPIFHYQVGKKASESLPDSDINPYLEFNDGSTRRMFKTTDSIMREYHIKLPPGEFIFGYVVQAAWLPPSVKPVTDPANDFPVDANAEDPVFVSFNQYTPMDPYAPGEPWEKVFAKTRFRMGGPTHKWSGGSPYLYAPDITPWQQPPKWKAVAQSNNLEGEIEPGLYEIDMFCDLYDGFDQDPYVDGTYPAVIAIASYWLNEEGGGIVGPPHLISCPITFHIVEVELLSTGPD